MTSITPFPDITLTFQAFRWLSADAWSDIQFDYFGQKRALVPEQIFRPPVYVKKGKNPCITAARWVLDRRDDTARPLGWAEAQRFTGTFTSTWLFFDRDTASDDEVWFEGLALLVSAILIVGDTDLVRIVRADGSRGSLESELDLWGTTRPVVSLIPEPLWLTFGKDPFVGVSTVEVSSQSWWASQRGAKAHAALSYLSKRAERERRRTAPHRASRPRRGLIQRLFRPTVD